MTTTVWLFHSEGQARYTYERSEISVRNDSVTYDGMGLARFAAANSFVEIACQPPDDEQGRACAFDAHLIDHPPGSLPGVHGASSIPNSSRVTTRTTVVCTGSKRQPARNW